MSAGWRRLRLVLLLAAGIGIPSYTGAGWEYFGEILLSAGRAGNPSLLDSDEPASQRRGQMLWTSRLTLGARAGWEKTDFEFSYSPYGELYEDSDLSQLSHALSLSWDHHFTPRLSLGLREDFSYNPKLPTDPNGAGIGGALVSDTSIAASDFRQSLSFRATEKSSLVWTYRNIERIYSSDQLLDTFGNAFSTEYSRTFGPHVVVSTGYEFGIYSFRDGEPPEVSTAFLDFCALNPVDPNCVTYAELLAQPPAGDQGFDRHRAYVGFGYDVPAGLHLTIDGGYDLLVYSQNDFGSVSRPFARASAGWNGTRFYARVGYEQGLDEGGGILTNAEFKRGQATARVIFTDNASLDLSVSRDVRESLDIDGGPTGITLTTVRGGSSFTYKLQRGWALIASYGQDFQTSRGTSSVPAEIRSNRYAMGASWNFGRRESNPAGSTEGITR